MSLKVAVQMDPLEAIKIEGDTTFLMMLTAQARGHSLFVYTPDRLSLEEGKVLARGRSVSVNDVNDVNHVNDSIETFTLYSLGPDREEPDTTPDTPDDNIRL